MLHLLAAHEVHPAGYFLMLWAWPHGSLLSARALSWLPAVAVAPILQLAAPGYGVRRAWLAGLVAATSPFLGYFAAEVRMYSWAALFGALVVLLVSRLPELPGWRWGIGMGSLAAFGMYLHYYSAFVLAGLLLVLIWRRQIRLAAIVTGSATLLFVPGLLLLASQSVTFLGYSVDAWQAKLTLRGLYSVSGMVFGGAEVDEWGRRAALLLAIPALGGLWRAPVSLRLLVGAGAGAPLLIGTFTTSLSPRYLAAVVPALLICLTLAIDSAPRRWAVGAGAAAALVGAGLVAFSDVRPDPYKPPVPGLIATARGEGALVVVSHRHFAPQTAYYAPGGEAFAFPPPRVDHVGLWALPAGLAYPPADPRPLLLLDYCWETPALPAGYRAALAVRYPDDLCVTRARPG